MKRQTKADLQALIIQLQNNLVDANRKRNFAEAQKNDALERLDMAHLEIDRLHRIVETERDKRGDLIMETQQAIPLVMRLMTMKRPPNNEFDNLPF